MRCPECGTELEPGGYRPLYAKCPCCETSVHIDEAEPE